MTWGTGRAPPHAPAMFVVTEADAAAIRAVFEQRGELSAAIELRRRFPGITDNAQARECPRTIAGWKPLPLRPVKRLPTLLELCRQCGLEAPGDYVPWPPFGAMVTARGQRKLTALMELDPDLADRVRLHSPHRRELVEKSQACMVLASSLAGSWP
jgi:hypothetical protein